MQTDDVWVCPNCAEENNAELTQCYICDEPRPLDWEG